MPELGKLVLIPTTLSEDPQAGLHPCTQLHIRSLRYFIVEQARTARRWIKAVCPEIDIQTLQITELDSHDPHPGYRDILLPALSGHSIGLMSEAGCPGVADPGANVVAEAHQLGIRVAPLVGPSALLLALMGSGMSGQSFCFHGYLSAKKPQLVQDLRRLESLATKLKQTQLFIEAPYRNHQILETAIQSLQPHTRLCVAVDLTGSTEWIYTTTIARWRNIQVDLHKRPAIFLIG